MTGVAIPSIHYLAILPVLIFFGAALVLLVASSLVRGATIAISRRPWRRGAPRRRRSRSAFFQWRDVADHGASTTVAHAMVEDGFAVVASARRDLARAALDRLVSHDWPARERVAGSRASHPRARLGAGAVLMAQANDLVVIFLGLEILSIGLYVLAAFDRRSRRPPAEAALKYFLLGGFASAIFVYGIALIYGATGTTTCSSIAYFLGSNVVLRPGPALAGGALLLVGFAFKVAAVPFHVWSPDVYEGAPTPVTGCMAAIVKVGAFAAVLARPHLGPRHPARHVASDRLGAGRAHLLVGASVGLRPAQREAPARVLLDQPRRLHAARRVGGHARAASRRRSSTS